MRRLKNIFLIFDNAPEKKLANEGSIQSNVRVYEYLLQNHVLKSRSEEILYIKDT